MDQFIDSRVTAYCDVQGGCGALGLSPQQEVNSKGPSSILGNIESCRRKDDLEAAARAEKAEAN